MRPSSFFRSSLSARVRLAIVLLILGLARGPVNACNAPSRVVHWRFSAVRLLNCQSARIPLFDPRTPPPDHAALTQVLEAAGVMTSAAEAHGILTGTLCAPGPARAPWADLIFGRGPAPVKLLPLFEALYRHVADRLENPDFKFEPLLPGVDEELGPRVEALADWCRGFVLGLGVDPYRAVLSPELQEILGDLMKIAELSGEEAGDDEDSACAFEEVAEYVRVGAQLLFEEAHPAASEDRP